MFDFVVVLALVFAFIPSVFLWIPEQFVDIYTFCLFVTLVLLLLLLSLLLLLLLLFLLKQLLLPFISHRAPENGLFDCFVYMLFGVFGRGTRTTHIHIQCLCASLPYQMKKKEKRKRKEKKKHTQNEYNNGREKKNKKRLNKGKGKVFGVLLCIFNAMYISIKCLAALLLLSLFSLSRLFGIILCVRFFF